MVFAYSLRAIYKLLGPKSEPPMPIWTTLVKGLLEDERIFLLCICSTKDLIFSSSAK